MATTTTNNGWTIPQSTDLVSAGATAIATLGSGIDTSVGTGLLTWTSYTPTLTGLTSTAPTVSAHYAKLGKIVHVRLQYVFGGTITQTGALTFSLPVTAVSASSQITYGMGQLDDGATSYSTLARVNSTTVGTVYLQNAAGTYTSVVQVSNTVPAASWVTAADSFRLSMTYEAA